MPSIRGLTTTFALTAVETISPDVSNLVKKPTDYDTKTSQLKRKVLFTNMINILPLHVIVW